MQDIQLQGIDLNSLFDIKLKNWSRCHVADHLQSMVQCYEIRYYHSLIDDIAKVFADMRYIGVLPTAASSSVHSHLDTNLQLILLAL